jgi:hypothetical protein
MNNRKIDISDISNQNKTINSSFFKLYYDGIGFNGYSVRLSNFSLNNIPTNMTRLATCSVGMLSVMGDMIGISLAEDKDIRYKITVPTVRAELIHDEISKGRCHMKYDASVQENFIHLACEPIVHPRWSLGEIVTLCRGHLQPTYQGTEECLKNLLDEALSTMIRLPNNIQNNSSALHTHEETAHSQHEPLMYGLLAAGIFAMGSVGYCLYKSRQNNRSHLTNDLESNPISLKIQ